MAASRPRYTWRMWETALSNLNAGSALTFVLNTVGSWPDLGQGLGVRGDFTLRRVHGVIATTSENNGQATTLDGFCWGIIVAGRDAVAAGAVPDPVSDASDWLAYGTGFVSLASAGGLDTNHPMTTHVIDNKSMRKVNENNQDVILRMEALAGNVATISVHAAGRLLVSHGQR